MIEIVYVYYYYLLFRKLFIYAKLNSLVSLVLAFFGLRLTIKEILSLFTVYAVAHIKFGCKHATNFQCPFIDCIGQGILFLST